MKHTYTTVRQQINELVPELLELKWGCEVEVNVLGSWFKTIIDNNELAPNGDDGVKFSDSDCYSREDLKILGAEPQLHHVLKAMRSTGRVTAGAEFLLKIWNLDESLSGQNQDVLDFIGEVLSK